MFTIQEYVLPTTLEEAYDKFISRKNNTLLGGCAWLQMGNKRIGAAIDLSSLDLNFIEEKEDSIEIGAMTTFRELETNPLLNKYFNGIIPRSVENIIGVQFRSVVTVGGTIFSKYGFSDLITAFLCLNTDVVLFKAGRMSLMEFLERPYERDLLIKCIIKKEERKSAYGMLRNSISDYPLLNVSVSEHDGQWRVVVGARPATAKISEKASKFLSENDINESNIVKAALIAKEELTFGSNMRASKEYREKLAEVLVKRAIMEVLACK